MIVENIKEAQRVKTTFLIIPAVFALVAIIVLFLELKNGYLMIGVLAAVVGVIIIALSLMQYRYFCCEISQNLLQFKFHGVGPFNKEFKTYQMKPELFRGYKIKKTMFGLVPKITIYVIVRGEIAKYPEISISALTKAQREALEQGLTYLANINKEIS